MLHIQKHLSQFNASTPSDRLYPSRSSGRYYVLNKLRSHLEFVVNKYLREKKDLVLVDFGCGSMPYRSLFEPYVASYLGVDLPGNEKADLIISPDYELQLPKNYADIVLSTQVLEHVDTPLAYLDCCYRTLKPGGILILSTHGCWVYHPDPQDYWRWTSGGLRKILAESGFRIEGIHGLVGLAPTGMQLFQDALIPRIPPLIRPLFVGVFQLFIALLDKIHSSAERDEDACLFVSVCFKS